jgi:hypothetical protein
MLAFVFATASRDLNSTLLMAYARARRSRVESDVRLLALSEQNKGEIE